MSISSSLEELSCASSPEVEPPPPPIRVYDKGSSYQEKLKISHLKLLSLDEASQSARQTTGSDEELRTAPLFSYSVATAAGASPADVYPQHCLLTGILPGHGKPLDKQAWDDETPPDPRVFLNVNAPWSAFICGSQGSGKSYTLSCMLEACLKAMPQVGNVLPRPLAGLVFHYDKHVGTVGTICETAYLCSAGIPVRILVSESSHGRMERLYGSMKLPPSVRPPTVQVLKFKEKHINLERMLSMMCVSTDQRKPLYIEAIINILRNMACADPTMTGVKMSEFLARLRDAKLKPDQQAPLNLRLAILGSFLEGDFNLGGEKKPNAAPGPARPTAHDNAWDLKPGTLTIVDLSCPFVDEPSACALFTLCLSLFLEAETAEPAPRAGAAPPLGKIVALDEAHKFMSAGPGADAFTAALIASIRMQRHYGLRVVIATQEPTISPALMDLCSMTFIHRFSSPRWMKELRAHLPGLALRARRADERDGGEEKEEEEEEGVDRDDEVFSLIGRLRAGEAVLLCPTALLAVTSEGRARKLGFGRKVVRVRKRVTDDGGRSVMAT